MEFKEVYHDEDGNPLHCAEGIVLIPVDTERADLPTSAQVAQFVATERGGQWRTYGGWHQTHDTDAVYIGVERVA